MLVLPRDGLAATTSSSMSTPRPGSIGHLDIAVDGFDVGLDHVVAHRHIVVDAFEYEPVRDGGQYVYCSVLGNRSE